MHSPRPATDPDDRSTPTPSRVRDVRYLEDLTPGEVHEFGSYVLTDTEIIEMGTRFDPQPWHLDAEAAKDSIFGELVASATHLGCVMSALHSQDPRPVAMVAGLGQRETKLVAPGRVGDVLRLRLEILSARPSSSRPTTGVVEMQTTLLDQDDRVVYEVTAAVLIERRPA